MVGDEGHVETRSPMPFPVPLDRVSLSRIARMTRVAVEIHSEQLGVREGRVGGRPRQEGSHRVHGDEGPETRCRRTHLDRQAVQQPVWLALSHHTPRDEDNDPGSR